MTDQKTTITINQGALSTITTLYMTEEEEALISAKIDKIVDEFRDTKYSVTCLFVVGDKVWHPLYGKGKIVEVKAGGTFPVYNVKFKSARFNIYRRGKRGFSWLRQSDLTIADYKHVYAGVAKLAIGSEIFYSSYGVGRVTNCFDDTSLPFPYNADFNHGNIYFGASDLIVTDKAIVYKRGEE